MVISELSGKWILRLFPPLLFNRVWVKNIGKGYKSCEVQVYKSMLNRNLYGTIFGGSIFSAADPFYAFMFWQIFARKGIRVQTWLKSAHIQYKKPADTTLKLSFHLSEEDIRDAEAGLSENGKYVKSFSTDMINARGEICAVAITEVYIRNTLTGQKPVSGF